MSARTRRLNRNRMVRRQRFEQLEARNLLATLSAIGAGNYRLALHDQGTVDPADDVAELFKSTSATPVASVLFSSLTDVSVSGALNSSDSLQIDFAGGNPIPSGGVSFDGLNGTGSDTLSFTAGTHTLTTYAYTNAKDGLVTFDGLNVSFFGLEPITNTGTTTDVVFQLPTTPDNVTLSELAGGELRLAGATIETTTISKPTGSLSVVGGSNDTITVGGAINLALGSADLSLQSRTVNVNRSITTSGDIVTSGSDTLDLAVGMSLTSGGVVSMNHAGSIELRGPVAGSSISLNSGSTSSNAIWGVTDGATLNATDGGIVVSSTSGGIDFGSSSIAATGLVQLQAGAIPGPTTSVTVKSVTGGTGVVSTGGGAFDLLASGSISSAATVQIDHGGSIELRSALSGTAITLESDFAGSNAIWGVLADANLTSLAGDTQLFAANGGINFGLSKLQSSENVLLSASTSTSVKWVAAEGSFTSASGGEFDSMTGGSIDVNDATTLNHAGTIELRGPIAAATVSLTSGATSSLSIWGTNAVSSITTTVGDLVLTSESGGINFGETLLDSAADVKLVSGTQASVKLVAAEGIFSSLGSGDFDSLTAANVAANGAITIQHGGSVELRGPVTGASVSVTSGSTSSNAIYAVNAGSFVQATAGSVSLVSPVGGLEFGVTSIAASNNISLSSALAVNVKNVSAGGTFSSIGTGSFDAMTNATIAAAGLVNIEHGGAVILRGPVAGSSVSMTSASTSTNAIWTTAPTFDLTSTSGSIVLATPAGGVNLLGNVTITGGDFSTSGAKAFTLAAGRTIDTNGGVAAFDHDGVVTLNGTLQTEGGALDIALKLVTANPGAMLFIVASGDIQFTPGSQLDVDASAVDISSSPPLKFFNVLRATNGDILGLNHLNLTSSVDLDGNSTVFTKQVIASGSSEILQLKGIETAPIIASGAGNYRLVLNPQGVGTDDDVIELYRNAVLVASRNYLATTYVQVSGATGSTDSLEVDYSGGTPIPVGNVAFDGLAGTGSDSLSITHGSHTTTTYNYSGAEIGAIHIDGGVIHYTEVEQPINTTSATVNAVFNLPAGATSATLAELAGGGTELNATTITRTTIVDPTGSLVVNGDANDSVTVGGTLNFSLSTASLTLVGENISFSKSASATSVALNASGTTGTAVRFTVSGALSATTGNIDIASAGGISFGVATTNALDGDINLAAAGAVVLGATSAGGAFTSVGTGTFEKNATGTLVVAESVEIDHVASVTVRAAVEGATVAVSSAAITSTAIQLVGGGTAGFTATTGGLTLTSAGGLSLAPGSIQATGGDIVLSSVGTVTLGNATVASGSFESAGAGAFDLSSGKSIVASGSVTIDHLSAIFRGAVNGSSIAVESTADTVSSIWTNVAAGVLTATSGDIELTATQGGINFAVGTLSAIAGDVILQGQKAINVKTVIAGDEFSSTSAGEFDMAGTGASVSAGGTVQIHHGSIVVRGPISGSSIELQSSATTATSILSVGVISTLTAATDVLLTATAGGISLMDSNISSTTGDVELAAVKSIAVRGVSAPEGNIGVTGDADFDMAIGGSFLTAGGNITLDHVGSIIVRGPITGDQVTLESESATSAAISAASTTPTVTANSDLVLVANTGGISFGGGNLAASGAVALSAATNVLVRGVSAGGEITSTAGGSFDTATSGTLLTAGGAVHIDHLGVILFRGPITGASILLETASAAAAAIHGVNASSKLTSTAGNVTLDAVGGVLLNGNVEVNGGETTPNVVNLTWGATSNLPNGVLGVGDMVGGSTRTFTNPGNGGFDVEVKFSGNFHGGYAGANEVLPPGNYIWFQSNGSSGSTFAWFEVSFFLTGTNTPVDVIGLKTTFEDVERGGGGPDSTSNTREWLIGPKVISSGVIQNLDFTDASKFAVPSLESYPAYYGYKLVGSEWLSRVVPGHGIQGGTQANKSVGVDLSTTPLSYFRIGQHRILSSAGSVLMAGLGEIQLASTVASPGLFSSTGTVFTAHGNIVVASQGNMELHHSGSMNIYGTLDAGNYNFVDTNATSDVDVILRSTSLLKLYVDVQAPPASPLLTMSGGGNLWFLNGSDIEILTIGTPTPASNGVYSLAVVADDGIVDDDGFAWFESGPGTDAVDSVFADDNWLQLLLEH